VWTIPAVLVAAGKMVMEDVTNTSSIVEFSGRPDIFESGYYH